MKISVAEEFAAVPPRAGLAGWIAKALPEGLLAGFLAHPGHFFAEPEQVLKDDVKTAVVQISLAGPGGAPRRMVAKRFRYGLPLRRLGFRFSESPALRSLKGALLLKRRGFDTPEPLAVLEFRDWKRLGTSFYLAAEVENSCSLRAFWLEVAPALAKKERIRIGRSIIRQLARLFARLHAAGIYHGDLKGSNILMQDWRSEDRRFFLVDLDRVSERRLSPGR
ncbi:MAG TPA: lipopolysaccharide kinase InaA family protein, partial [Candidatus Binatia bacterium]